MTHQKGHSAISVIITILLTALVVGYGTYTYMESKVIQQEDTFKAPEAVKVMEEDYNLLIKQGKDYENTVLKLKSAFPEGAGFKLEFPWHWGLVTVERMDLTATDAPFPEGELRQYVGYKIISGNQSHTHHFTIYVSNVKYKDDSLVTQGGRIFLAEDEDYFYNHLVPTRNICGEGALKCPEEKSAKIINDINEVVQTFKILK